MGSVAWVKTLALPTRQKRNVLGVAYDAAHIENAKVEAEERASRSSQKSLNFRQNTADDPYNDRKHRAPHAHHCY